MTEGNAIDGLSITLSAIGDYINPCSELRKAKRRGIAFGIITRSYTDRIIVAGEAAEHIKTTTGGGINYGLLSAEVGSEIIKNAFEIGEFGVKTHPSMKKSGKRWWQKKLSMVNIFIGFILN